MAKKKYSFLEKIVNRIENDLMEDRVPFFPLIDPNKIELGKIGEYLGSKEFLGSNVWLWKEMRKIKK
jgi:hypothetical protein